MLGMTRVYGIRRHILEEAAKDRGFSDMRDSPYRDRPTDTSPEARIRRLEHELAYTKQELDFVKKILAANREACQE
jgi:transposase